MPPPSDYLRGLIAEQGGTISVERFMREALYHPQYGYYTNRVRRIGSGGDFATSVTLHEALPRALAAWAAAHRHEMLYRGEWHLIELGGGGGQLAAGLLGALGWFARRRVRYHLVEISRPLRTLQQERLVDFSRQVQWHEDVADAVAAAGGRALIISNEFVDAFPCLQLQCGEEKGEPWHEVSLQWPGSTAHPVEVLAPWPGKAHSPIVSSVLAEQYGSSLQAGQRVEVHHSYKQWLEGWVPRWQQGRMLTIDYGDMLPQLYYRRPQGSLRAYARHQRIVGAGVYQNFGQQDLTADVNFTDLEAWGTTLGLQPVKFCTHADFIETRLPVRWLTRRRSQDPALTYLLDETGAGSAFKVLEQVRSSR